MVTEGGVRYTDDNLTPQFHVSVQGHGGRMLIIPVALRI